jgi:hypothetical protein
LKHFTKIFVGARRGIVGPRFELDSCDKPEIAKCIENLETVLHEFATYPRSPKEAGTPKTPPVPPLPQTFSAQYYVLFTSLALTNAHRAERVISPGKDHSEL